MSFTFRPAKREKVNLLIGIAGPSGSGKTFSAMRLASGLCGDQRFAVIDTEAGRASHYAEQFAFDVGELNAPFRPEAYAEAIIAADKAGYPVIVVDQMSNEHAGDGGLLDWHEEELNRLAGDDYKKRDTFNMLAWAKVKISHKKMMSQLLQIRSHLIICFRAEEKIEIIKENGKTKIVPKQTITGLDGYVPICEKTLPYELTASFLMTPDAPGFPKPIKLQEQHRSIFPLDKPIDEDSGRRVAQWAAGGTPEDKRITIDAHKKAIAEALNVDALQARFGAAWRDFKDVEIRAELTNVKDARKAALSASNTPVAKG